MTRKVRCAFDHAAMALAMLWAVAAFQANASPPPYEVWSRTINSSGIDFAGGAAADGLGNVYFSGETTGRLGSATSGGYDAFVGKYGASGNKIWIRQFGSSSDHESAPGIDVSDSGDVIVAGTTDGAIAGQNFGVTDGFVRKYDADGIEKWTIQFGSPVFDRPYDVDVSPSGDVYVGGYTYDTLSVSNSTGFVNKLASNGASIWSRSIGAVGGAYAFGVAADAVGNAVVVGQTNFGTAIQGSSETGSAFVAKFDVDSNLVWTRQFGNYSASARDVAIDALGNCYVAGFEFVKKFSSDGLLIWTAPLNTNATGTDVALDGLGRLIVGGAQPSGPFYNLYDVDGLVLFERVIDVTSAYQANIATDGLDNVYVYQTVQVSQDFDTVLLKHTIVPEPGAYPLAIACLLAAETVRRRQC